MQIAQLSRPSVRHSGRLLIAVLDPARFEASVTESVPEFAGGDSAQWRLTVDGTFFDESERPIYLLQDGPLVHAPFRSGTSAVFWCRDGACDITHARDYDPYRAVDIAVQSSPRVFANSAPTVGVRNANSMASRAGLAITQSGQVVVFATDRWPWQGLTFNEVSRLVAPLIDATDILMLDGGSSVVFQMDAPGFSLSARGSGRSVPYMISFAGT
ncbi:MAG: phosphodiester glycosidase family protein [Pseudomonadota bacterium]